MQRVFVIADVHGEFAKLKTVLGLLYTEANFNPYKDLLVQLGDKNDRGQHTYEVIETFRKLHLENPENIICLFGNHETWMLDQAHKPNGWDAYWYPNNGGLETLHSYARHTGLDASRFNLGKNLEVTWHEQFLMEHHYLFFETDDYFFSHAPIPNVGFGRRRIKDYPFRTDADLLTWTYVNAPEKLWIDPDPCDGKLCIYGHVHGIHSYVDKETGEEGLRVPGIRRYGNTILLDTGCGCADAGYLSCLELPDLKVYDSRGEIYQLKDGNP